MQQIQPPLSGGATNLTAVAAYIVLLAGIPVAQRCLPSRYLPLSERYMTKGRPVTKSAGFLSVSQANAWRLSALI
jgi:hypothetical protein